jgi:hypothetical protein
MESHWSGYLAALGKNKRPVGTIDSGAFPTTEGNTISTGFVEWKTPNPKLQARYDAMSGSWQGIKASEAGVNQIYKPEFAPVNNK